MERPFTFFHTAMGLVAFVAGLIAWVCSIVAIAAWAGASWWGAPAIVLGAVILVVVSFKVDDRFRESQSR